MWTTLSNRLVLVLALAACGEGPPTVAPVGADAVGVAAATPSVAPPLIVFLGDSLTAGLGLSEEQAFPAVLGEMLAARGTPVRVVNAGVSGDTSAGGLRRLDWLLGQRPDLVVVELGANDGLRGLPLAHTEDNLRQIISRCRAAGSEVLLLGMLLPPNYGDDYTSGFAAIFPRLANELDLELVDFLLAGVGGVLELNQGDGMHPTAEGQRRMAANVLPVLAELVEVLTISRRASS